MNIPEALDSRILICDGAMGTQLQAAGLPPGSCGELWNLHKPEIVLGIHRAYREAGADFLTTNTFGASRLGLQRHNVESETESVNRRAVELAREALGEASGWVLGDLGPFGGLMAPLGTTGAEEVRAAFLEQARYLVEAGVDGILIETMTAIEELEIAIQCAREAGAAWVAASMSFDSVRGGQDYRTMMGVSPEQAAESVDRWGADVLGVNCGANLDCQSIARILERYRKASRLPLLAQPNAGSPCIENGRVFYRQTPGALAEEIAQVVSAGARIVGACCGSTPGHINAIRLAVL